ncbi:hypothetical protein ACEQUB_02821 [Ralstonia syzygii]
MTIRNSLQAASSRTLIAATVLAMLALAGCASGGNPNGDTPASTANNDPGAVPVGNVASNGGNVVTQTGKTVSDLGTQIGTAQVPLIGGTAAQKDLGATVTSAGNAIQTLGTGISNGLGKTGSTPDPVGTTMQKSGPVQQVTQQTSNAIVPLASQVARGTQQVGSATMLGAPLANALNRRAVAWGAPADRSAQPAATRWRPMSAMSSAPRARRWRVPGAS